MNPSSLVAVLETIEDQVDRLPDVAEYGTLTLEYDGEKVDIEPARLADDEVKAIKWGLCGALTGVISLLKGEEQGNGHERIAENMFLAAVAGQVFDIDEES